MAVETKEVTVGDKLYTVQQFTASRGLKIFNSLIKLIGGSLAELLGDEGSDLAQAAKSGDTSILVDVAFASAVDKFIDSMDKVDTVQLCKDLLSGTFDAQTSQPVNFDMDFAGDYGTMLALIIEVVKINYGSVFSGGALSLGALPAASP